MCSEVGREKSLSKDDSKIECRAILLTDVEDVFFRFNKRDEIYQTLLYGKTDGKLVLVLQFYLFLMLSAIVIVYSHSNEAIIPVMKLSWKMTRLLFIEINYKSIFSYMSCTRLLEILRIIYQNVISSYSL